MAFKEDEEVDLKSSKEQSNANELGPHDPDKSRPALQEVNNQTLDLQVAPAPKRVIAAIIDYGLVYVITTFLLILFFQPITHYIIAPKELMSQMLWPKAIMLGIGIVSAIMFPLMYFVLSESSNSQATPGKKLMGIQVAGVTSIQIGYWRSLLKGILQSIVGYVLGLVVAFSFGLIDRVINLGGLSRLLAISAEMTILGVVFCIPLFNNRTQSILDKLCGRRVIVSVGKLSPETQRKERFAGRGFRNFSIGLIAFGFVAGLIASVPYFLWFIPKSIDAFPIAEQGFELKNTGKNEEGKKLLDQSRKIFPDLEITYLSMSSLSKLTGNYTKEEEYKKRMDYFTEVKTQESYRNTPQRHYPGEPK